MFGNHIIWFVNSIKKGILHVQIQQACVVLYMITAFIAAIRFYYKCPFHRYVHYVLVCNYIQKCIGLILVSYSLKNDLSAALQHCIIVIVASWILQNAISMLAATALYIMKKFYSTLKSVIRIAFIVIWTFLRFAYTLMKMLLLRVAVMPIKLVKNAFIVLKIVICIIPNLILKASTHNKQIMVLYTIFTIFLFCYYKIILNYYMHDTV